MRALKLPTVLSDVGLVVARQDGWHSRGHELHAIRGVVWHHTATPKSASDSGVIRVLRDGRSGIPGPLSQLGVDRDGVWHIIASGRANHAGRGAWPGLDGNDDCLGIEAFHAGTRDEPWTDRQVESLQRGTAAICATWGIPAGRVIAHKEWAPGRKIDPYGFDMDHHRHVVAAALAEGQKMAGTPSSWAREDFDKALRAGVFSEHTDPKDNVTAEQLAVFLGRAGVLDTTTPAGEHTHTARIQLT